MQPISLTRKLLLSLTAIALCVGLTANTARADVVGTLIPANSPAIAIVGEPASNLANEILLGTDLINVALGNPLISANLANAVYRNSAGTLDFLYQLTNNANSVPISSIAVNNYAGVITRAGYLTGALPANATGVFVASAGSLPPTTVQRGPAGADLLFDGFTVPAGTISNVFFVSTNFTNFNALGQALAAATTQANGGAVFITKFQPTAAIPEPSTFAMVGLMSMAGLGFAWKRRRATV